MDRTTLLFAALAAVLLVALAVVLLAAIPAWRRLARGAALSAETPAGRAADGGDGLEARLDEMVRKTNERNNYINSIFASMEDGIVLVDASNRIVLYNPRAEALLGLGPFVFFEGRSGARRTGAEASSVLDICREVTGAGRGMRRELATAQGMILDVRVVPVADKYRKAVDLGALAIVKDVTEMRKLESVRKDFVATVSHEFRTPLTLISGFMEMLRMRDDIGEGDRKRAFEILEIETERLKRLVSELLTLSEIENSLPRDSAHPIDVAEVISSLATSLGGLAERKGQRFRTEVRVDAGILRGNEGWFYQAVKNLVENAIKYTPEGGAIGIDVMNDERILTIAVSDTGIGIAADEFERIFERFYRVEKSRGSGAGGSGLGLALVKDTVSIFGGSIEVVSKPGEGSVFTMRLPVQARRANGQG